MLWKNRSVLCKIRRVARLRVAPIQVYGASVVRTDFGIVNTVEISGIPYPYQFYR